MPIFFDEKTLTKEQRERYDWAVAEYTRIQKDNLQRQLQNGQLPAHQEIGPKSALFARLLEGKEALPYPPPTSYSYPWYAVIESPGKHHVSIGAPWMAHAPTAPAVHTSTEDFIILNQCRWKIVNKNDGAAQFQAFMRQVHDPDQVSDAAMALLRSGLAGQPEFFLTFGHWGEFRLSLGRIIRRGRRGAALRSRFDVRTLDGGNPEIVEVLRTGAEIRAKSDATLAGVLSKPEGPELTPFERITLASEYAIPRSDTPEDDDLVEYDCDGWVIERCL